MEEFEDTNQNHCQLIPLKVPGRKFVKSSTSNDVRPVIVMDVGARLTGLACRMMVDTCPDHQISNFSW